MKGVNAPCWAKVPWPHPLNRWLLCQCPWGEGWHTMIWCLAMRGSPKTQGCHSGCLESWVFGKTTTERNIRPEYMWCWATSNCSYDEMSALETKTGNAPFLACQSSTHIWTLCRPVTMGCFNAWGPRQSSHWQSWCQRLITQREVVMEILGSCARGYSSPVENLKKTGHIWYISGFVPHIRNLSTHQSQLCKQKIKKRLKTHIMIMVGKSCSYTDNPMSMMRWSTTIVLQTLLSSGELGSWT